MDVHESSYHGIKYAKTFYMSDVNIREALPTFWKGFQNFEKILQEKFHIMEKFDCTKIAYSVATLISKDCILNCHAQYSPGNPYSP